MNLTRGQWIAVAVCVVIFTPLGCLAYMMHSGSKLAAKENQALDQIVANYNASFCDAQTGFTSITRNGTLLYIDATSRVPSDQYSQIVGFWAAKFSRDKLNATNTSHVTVVLRINGAPKCYADGASGRCTSFAWGAPP